VHLLLPGDHITRMHMFANLCVLYVVFPACILSFHIQQIRMYKVFTDSKMQH